MLEQDKQEQLLAIDKSKVNNLEMKNEFQLRNLKWGKHYKKIFS